MTPVEISVVVACRNARRTIRACLDSLAVQRTGRKFETIVADSSTDGTDQIIRAEFPWVRLLHLETRKFPGDARNAGIREAHGEWLAFVDSDCVAAPDWLKQMAMAQRDSNAMVGGVVDNGARERLPDGAGYLSFHRKLFDEFGPFREGVYCSGTALHWVLARARRRARFVPIIQVSHHSQERPGVHQRESLKRRCRMYAGGAVLLPAVLWTRIAGRVLRNRRYGGEFALSTTPLVLGLAVRSLGEMRGNRGSD